MVEVSQAAFKFEGFKIPEFSYTESKKVETSLKLAFEPSGRYHPPTGVFEIEIDFTGFDEDDLDFKIIKVKTLARFKFSENLPLEEIPSFFYTNSIPIVFPYIRAFISTLTLQANTGLIILGLMNFSNMDKALRNNTSVVGELGL